LSRDTSQAVASLGVFGCAGAPLIVGSTIVLVWGVEAFCWLSWCVMISVAAEDTTDTATGMAKASHQCFAEAQKAFAAVPFDRPLRVRSRPVWVGG
jgi:hypothetical protein